jgi:hypothetical protein
MAKTKIILLQHKLRTPSYNSIFRHQIQQHQKRNSGNLVIQVELEEELLAVYIVTETTSATAQDID